MTTTRAYLDCNASEPLRAQARTAMLAALEQCANPSSVHAEGRRARGAVETAREQVAALVGARAADVVFTSGATEANNAVLAQGWRRVHLAAIEHDSVLRPAEAGGADMIALPLDTAGRIDPARLGLPSVAPDVRRALVSVQLAGNETGVVQPLAEIAAAAHGAGALVHSDAAQAAGRTTVDFTALGLDYMSLSAHKLGGPQGVGALVVRDGAPFAAVMRGGGQERGRRAGSENVAGIAGFGAAAAAALAEREALPALRHLRDDMEREALRLLPGTLVVGAEAERLPNTSCLVLPGLSAEMAVIRLDLAGIAVSAGAACSSGKVGPNRVLLALGLAPELARRAIRVSLSTRTTRDEVARFLAAWATLAPADKRAALPASTQDTHPSPGKGATALARAV